MDMEDVLLLTAGMLAEEERVAAQVRAQYKWFVVDEFQDVSPIQSALLDLWLGGRDEICVVGDPAQTIYSFAGADATTCATSRASSPAPPRSSSPATTARRPRSSRPPTPCSPGSRLDLGAAARPAPERAAGALRARPPTRWPRPTRSPTAVGALRRATACPRPRSPCCSASTPSPRRSRRPWRRRGLPYVVRGAARFFERGRGAAGGRPCSAPRSAPTAARPRCSTWCARRWRAWAGRPRRPPTRGQTRDRWESLQALMTMAEEAGDLDRRRRSSPTSTAARPSSTPPPPVASPWPRSTPPRAWSGTPSSWPACTTARCR